MKLHHLLSPFTVIASARSKEEVEEAARRGVRDLFLVYSSLGDVRDYARLAEAQGIRLYVYFDMIKGLSQDREAVQYLLREVRLDGIVSNKTHIVNEAMNIGVYGIFNLFLLDSHSLRKGSKLIADLKPDAVNIAPGNLPAIIPDLVEVIDSPIIASGLIRRFEEVKALYEAGASAVSTSQPELWSVTYEQLEEDAPS